MSALGILNPAGLAALAIVGALIALHLWQRRRAVVPVTTLFLWTRIPAAPPERRRFRPTMLFWLRVAAAVVLVGGLLRPYVTRTLAPSTARPLLLVLDVSASMQARETTGSRFAIARRHAAAALATLAPGDDVMVVTADDHAHVLERWTSDHTRVRRRLETLEPVDTPTNLTPALTLALGEAHSHPGTRVLVLTDVPPEESGIAAEALTTVDYVRIGTTDDNRAIASLTVDVPPFRDAAPVVATVVVRNYAATAERAVLAARIDGEPWAWRTLTLAPHAAEHVSLVDPPREGVLEVELVTGDALAVDNSAFAWISKGAALDVLLVSDSHALTTTFAEVVAAIAGSRVEVMSRTQYEHARPAGRRVALFDGFVPRQIPPAVNALYVVPPPNNPLCPSAGMLDDAAVIDWDAHPVLAGLDELQAIVTARASQLGTPPWGAAIVYAASAQRAFPFLVAGEREGRRIACLAGELAGPLASSDRLPLLMLTLGTLRWLAEPFAGSARTIETGAATLAGSGPRGPVHGPDGGGGLEVIGDPPVFLARRAGVYRVGPAGGARLVLANFLDDRESDIGRAAGPARIAADRETALPPPTAPPREVGWWLTLLGAALLVAEWLTWRRTGGEA
jgi:hypothetical protein